MDGCVAHETCWAEPVTTWKLALRVIGLPTQNLVARDYSLSDCSDILKTPLTSAVLPGYIESPTYARPSANASAHGGAVDWARARASATWPDEASMWSQGKKEHEAIQVLEARPALPQNRNETKNSKTTCAPAITCKPKCNQVPAM